MIKSEIEPFQVQANVKITAIKIVNIDNDGIQDTVPGDNDAS